MEKEAFVDWLTVTLPTQVVLRIQYLPRGEYHALAFTGFEKGILLVMYNRYGGFEDLEANLDLSMFPAVDSLRGAVDSLLGKVPFNCFWRVPESVAGYRTTRDDKDIGIPATSLSSLFIFTKLVGAVEMESVFPPVTHQTRSLLLKRTETLIHQRLEAGNEAVIGLAQLFR